jgi:hypothetical protein
MSKTRVIRVDEGFASMLDDLCSFKSSVSYPKVTRVIVKYIDFPEVKRYIIRKGRK